MSLTPSSRERRSRGGGRAWRRRTCRDSKPHRCLLHRPSWRRRRALPGVVPSGRPSWRSGPVGERGSLFGDWRDFARRSVPEWKSPRSFRVPHGVTPPAQMRRWSLPASTTRPPGGPGARRKIRFVSATGTVVGVGDRGLVHIRQSDVRLVVADEHQAARAFAVTIVIVAPVTVPFVPIVMIVFVVSVPAVPFVDDGHAVVQAGAGHAVGT